MTGSPRAADAPEVLVVSSDQHLVRRWQEAIGLAQDAGVPIALATIFGTGWEETSSKATVHRLSAANTHSRWRRPLLRLAGLSTRPRRAALAARFDPWLRSTARAASLVLVPAPSDDAIERAVRLFAPDVEIRRGEDELVAVLKDHGSDAIVHHLSQALDGEPQDEHTTELLRRGLALAEALHGRGIQMTGAPAALLRGLPPSTLGPEHSELVLPVLGRLGLLPPAVLLAYRARYELDNRGSTGGDPSMIGARVLEAVDQLTEEDPDDELEWICLALEVVFHRELHSDSVDSPLLSDPGRFLAPLRRTKTWTMLTTLAPGPSSTETAVTPAEVPPWRPAVSHQRQVLMLPGAYGSFQAPLESALHAVPSAAVRSVRRRELPGHLRTMGMTRQVVRRRLEAAQGREVQGYRMLREALVNTPTDVVVIDWADKTAVLTSLLAPPSTRIVLRVHGVDLLRPWIHLLDWERVDTLICVSEPLMRAAREIVGDRLDHVTCAVVPNLVDLDRLAAVADSPRDHQTLCVVGWAQRVKDPLWALTVLARLRAGGGDWRLLLIGADFPDRPTASGARYADLFRRRAMGDDVREHIEYTGFVTDLAPVLARAGFVLSSSLREGWPVGLAEGVAAGAVPVVRQWPMLANHGSARQVWPEWVVEDEDEAVRQMVELTEQPAWLTAARQAREILHDRADPTAVTRTLRELVLGTAGRLAHASLTGNHAEARALAVTVLEQDQVDPPLLLQAAISAGQAGEPSLRQHLLRRWDQDHPHPYVSYQLGRQEGVLRELSPAWRPQLTIRRQEGRDPVQAHKVLHLLKVSLPYRQSGYALRSFHILRELARGGRDVIAVTALDFPAGEYQGVRSTTDVVGGVRHERLLRDRVPERERADDRLQAFATALEAVVHREQPTVIHVHSGHRGYDLALVALAVGEAAGIPVVYEVRGFFEAVWTSATEWAEHAEMYRLRRRIEASCMHRSAAVVTLSESMRQDILARTIEDGLPAVSGDKVFVVPNGVAADLITPRHRRPELVEALGLQGSFTFGYVSNLDHQREGHEILIDAVLHLRRNGVAAVAVIVGDGVRAAELKTYADRVGAAAHVRFTGRVPFDEVSDYYALLDVFVVPRVHERAAELVTPLKPFEAMAAGLPVVVSDLPALLEIIGEGLRGDSFPAGRSEELARVLRSLAEDPARRAELGRAAQEWVRSQRTWETVTAGYDQVYEHALASPRKQCS